MKTATIPAILFLAACGQPHSIASQDHADNQVGTLAASVPVASNEGSDAGPATDANIASNPNAVDPNSGSSNQACAPTLDGNTIDPNILAAGGNPTCNPVDPNTKDLDYRYGKWTLQIGGCIETNVGPAPEALDYAPESHGKLGPVYPMPDNLVIPTFSMAQDTNGAWTIDTLNASRPSAMSAGIVTCSLPAYVAFRTYPDGTARYIKYLTSYHGIVCAATAIPAP